MYMVQRLGLEEVVVLLCFFQRNKNQQIFYMIRYFRYFNYLPLHVHVPYSPEGCDLWKCFGFVTRSRYLGGTCTYIYMYYTYRYVFFSSLSQLTFTTTTVHVNKITSCLEKIMNYYCNVFFTLIHDCKSRTC